MPKPGSGGFLLIGEGAYLRPYQAAVARLEEQIARLKHLIADNPEQPRLSGAHDKRRPAHANPDQRSPHLLALTSKARPFVPVALEEVARQVVGDLEACIEEAGGQIEGGALPAIEADPVQMHQLLENLIGNALKFHLPGTPPMVRVAGAIIEGAEKADEASTVNGSCKITVEDNGIGIDEPYLDKIFIPFPRLRARGQYEGTGIGLAICRKIVERHGGRITATNAAGAGATFLVSLPLTHSGEQEEEKGKQEERTGTL